jgi:alpha,alpha-trehalase
MKQKKKQLISIKIFGIDSLFIVTDDVEFFKSMKGDKNTYLMDFSGENLPTSISIRKKLKDKIRRMNTSPERIIAASDSPTGIRAIKKASVAMVIGIHREGQSRKDLYGLGADYVLDSLSELEIVEGIHSPFHLSQELPGTFQFLNRDAMLFFQGNPVFFFDYDGTLSPIVKDPRKAYLRPSVRRLLKQLSEFYPVAIVSGRDLRDVRDFVQLDQLIYAGSHGYRITGPGGIAWTHSEAEKTFPLLDHVEERLRKKFIKQEGIMIERKYSALAIHYRNAPKHSYKQINMVVTELIREIPDLKKERGKKIIEIKPAFDWNKGKAVEWILRKMGYSDPDSYHPVYVGDDVTDEDAFRALADHGTSILVGDHGGISAADMHLRDSDQVEELLHVLVQESVLDKQKSLTFS